MQYVASLSYGKDSIAMLEVIKQNNLPLDRIVHVEIMATHIIHADLPPMLEFKAKADKIIKQRYGIEVEHLHNDKCFTDYLFKQAKTGGYYTYPSRIANWCNDRLKMRLLNQFKNCKKYKQYIGIACDEPERLERLKGTNKIAPLAEYGWTEKMAYDFCEDNDLLSPIYTDENIRGGCWFCYNMSIADMRNLRENYPEYWQMLLEWDKKSFELSSNSDYGKVKSGYGVKGERPLLDYDLRFSLEDEGFIDIEKSFRWSMLNNPYIQLEF